MHGFSNGKESFNPGVEDQDQTQKFKYLKISQDKELVSTEVIGSHVWAFKWQELFYLS